MRMLFSLTNILLKRRHFKHKLKHLISAIPYLDEVEEIHYEIHDEHGYYDQHDDHALHVIHDDFHDDPDGDLRDGRHLEDELLG